MTIAWEAAGLSDIGRIRSGNEDAFRMDAGRGVFLVADGMGGHAAGEVASNLASDTVIDSLTRALDGGARDESQVLEAMRASVLVAHERIVMHSTQNRAAKGMGTTLTACILTADGSCRIVHIGDSRLYRVRDGRLEQITHDHTWVQREIDQGRLAPTAARRHPLSHILTRVLTDDPAQPEVDLLSDPVLPGDLLLLATDGLYNMLDDASIAQVLLSADASLGERVQGLIDGANRKGGADNITVILVRVVAAG